MHEGCFRRQGANHTFAWFLHAAKPSVILEDLKLDIRHLGALVRTCASFEVTGLRVYVVQLLVDAIRGYAANKP